METIIQITKDYDIFKTRHGNREVIRSHVNKLAEDLTTYNFLRDKPVNVDKEMILIDGHHRVAAARKAGVEVFYTIVQRDLSNSNEMLVAANLNQKQFKQDDYVNFYADNGNKDYIFLRDLSRKFNLPYRCLLSLGSGIAGKRKIEEEKKWGKEIGERNSFKAGEWQCFDQEEFFSRCLFHQACMDIFDRYLQMQGKFYQSGAVAKALLILYLHPDFEQEHFLKNLERHWTMIGAQAKLLIYVKMFYMIYNKHLKVNKLSWELLDLKYKDEEILDI